MLPPFRDSNLTRLLKSMFLENGKAVILITLDPSAKYLEESMNSVRFARFARKVKTSIVKKDSTDGMSLPASIGTDAVKSVQTLKEEIDHLKYKLDQRRGQFVSRKGPDPVRFNAQLMRENERLKLLWDGNSVNNLMQENAHLKKEIERLKAIPVTEVKSQGLYTTTKYEEIDSTGSGVDWYVQLT